MKNSDPENEKKINHLNMKLENRGITRKAGECKEMLIGKEHRSCL
jgi:hypothetical protein